ncbi:hypothetical protein GCM10012286_76220 [Streptomyces lasiicapitis]|uniref:Collagen-like protein n=1 Tax=Streptomyces lasiicapitis TaxID=1923961 RepID=A0ABQ2MUH1_9ACTN|nr:hypothetical protein GCM10012286_76220 [Streptomyces lasiicapitis]
MNQGPRTGLRQKPGDDGDTGPDGVRARSPARREGVGSWPMGASSGCVLDGPRDVDPSPCPDRKARDLRFGRHNS